MFVDSGAILPPFGLLGASQDPPWAHKLASGRPGSFFMDFRGPWGYLGALVAFNFWSWTSLEMLQVSLGSQIEAFLGCMVFDLDLESQN